MNFVQELIKDLLPEQEYKKTVAVYGGGFKPPTKGHFEVVKQAIKENPDIDEFIINIGGKERDGVTPEDSLLIWDIYKQYLPVKTEIKLSSKPPIQAVYNYAKEHPEEQVLFVIGAREGNEDDFTDIAKRTKSVDNYPNLKVETVITQGGASGTAARNAAKTDISKLKPLLPKEISDEEVETIYNLISDKITENNPQDGKAAPYGSGYDEIDERLKKLKESKAILNWEKRVTIPGPVPPAFLEGDVLTYEGYKNRRGNVTGKYYPQRDYPVEVIEVKWNEDKKEYVYKVMLLRDLGYGEKRGMKVSGKSEKEIKDKLADKQLTRAEFERQISSGRGRNDSFDKPIKLPKKGSTFGWTGESKILKEVLNPKTFNFDPLLKSIVQSMEKDGLKLKPYPKVVFKHNEEANADNFFGNTAYYAPDSNEIVLYTLGRHPKDIMRSFAHELVHVHQNHEDRLHDITTDDINADEHLERLEREAYETGNIMFRSWTSKSKNESKDPFGLKAYAYDLAQLNENEENWYIYLDMDGVVANFNKRFEDLSGMLPQAFVDKNGLNAFWDLIDEKHKVAFWRGIEIMPGAEKLVNFVSKYPYEMLTAPSVKKQSIIGKGLWVKDKVGTLYPSKPKVTYRPAKLKHTVKPNLTQYDILIDDKKSTIDRWNNAGGTAIFYVNADQVIDELKNLGL